MLRVLIENVLSPQSYAKNLTGCGNGMITNLKL